MSPQLDKLFSNTISKFPAYLERLIESDPIVLSDLSASPKMAGIYVFLEKGSPVYVGRSRNFRQRMKSHFTTKNENASSFVYLMAFESSGRTKASYKKEGSRKQLYHDPEFRENYLLPANARLKVMDIKFIEITDCTEQALFEIYAAMALKTKYNSFRTS